MASKPIPAGVASAGNRLFSFFLIIFPFIIFSCGVIVYRYLKLEDGLTSWVDVLGGALVVWGTLLAWSQNFPRWSYPYFMVVIALLVSILFNLDWHLKFPDHIIFKLLVLSPVALMYAATWYFTREENPLACLVQNVRQDWTLIPYFIYGSLPVAICGIYGDIHTSYGAPFLAVSTLLAVGGACLFMALRKPLWRLFALIISMTLVWTITIYASVTYWGGGQDQWMAIQVNGYSIIAQFVLFWAVMLGLMLLPLVFITRANEPVKEPDLSPL